MQALANWLSRTLSLSGSAQAQWIETVLVIISLVLLNRIAQSVVRRRQQDVIRRHRWQKGIEYTTIVIGLTLIISIWLSEFEFLATYLGLLSAGIAVALSDILVNLAGWFYIITRRPFVVGDRIEVGNYAGDVVDTRFLSFTLREIKNWIEADQSTGRLLFVPNRIAFTHAVANYTTGFHYIWHEIPVLITLESDWRDAKRVLMEILHQRIDPTVDEALRESLEISQKATIKFGRLTPIVYTAVRQHGICLTLRFLCEPRKRRGITSMIWEDVLEQFRHHPDINLAYPTQRVYVNSSHDNQPPEAPYLAHDVDQ